MKPRMLTPMLIIAALLAATLPGCVVVPARPHAFVEVGIRPPPPVVVVAPAPRPGYVWAPGYWRWEGERHVWVDGRWIAERRGYHWAPDRWTEHNGRWRYEEGHWER
jgi:hypothetical protein